MSFLLSCSVFKDRSLWEVLDLSKLNRYTPYFLQFPLFFFLLRKEVIHPHVPVGIPCYDLTPVIGPAFDGSLLERLCHRLRALPTPMVWRAVCTRPENVFTATCWFAITSDSSFMKSGCRLQSELRRPLWDSLAFTGLPLFVDAIVVRV